MSSEYVPLNEDGPFDWPEEKDDWDADHWEITLDSPEPPDEDRSD